MVIKADARTATILGKVHKKVYVTCIKYARKKITIFWKTVYIQIKCSAYNEGIFILQKNKFLQN